MDIEIPKEELSRQSRKHYLQGGAADVVRKNELSCFEAPKGGFAGKDAAAADRLLSLA